MISLAKPTPKSRRVHVDYGPFLQMLPTIRRIAQLAFGHLGEELQEELICEVVANALVAFARLVERGKQDLAYPTPLANYAVRQIRVGRRVGSRICSRDVLAQAARARHGLTIERLDQWDVQRQTWREILVEDRHAGPAETAASRIDFADWLRTLSHRRRRIARLLATGESTSLAARRLGVSLGRISQIRQELRRHWEAFHAGAAAGTK